MLNSCTIYVYREERVFQHSKEISKTLICLVDPGDWHEVNDSQQVQFHKPLSWLILAPMHEITQ